MTVTTSGPMDLQVGDVVNLNGQKCVVTRVFNNTRFQSMPVRVCPECKIEYGLMHPISSCKIGCIETVMES